MRQRYFTTISTQSTTTINFVHDGNKVDNNYDNNDSSYHDLDDRLVQRNENEILSPQEMDRRLAQEMTKLTMDDRNKVLDEIHGVHDVVNEKIAQEKLLELQNMLDQYLLENDDNNNPAFVIAAKRNKELVYDAENLSKFLRADDYNLPIAFKRILLHYEKERELFGEEKLGRQIVLSDLDNNDFEALSSGFCQHLPCEDRTGRGMFLIIPSLRGNIDPINMCRALWYVGTHSGAGGDGHKKGTVVIIYYVGFPTKFDLKSASIPKIGNTLKCLPIKHVAVHVCYDQPNIRPFVPLILLFLGKDKRLRTRVHYGTAIECMYKLMTFGISQHAFPFNTIDGTYSPDNHLKWIQNRQQIDDNMHQKRVQEGQGGGEEILHSSTSKHHASATSSSSSSSPLPTPALTSTTAETWTKQGDNGTIKISKPQKNDVLFGKGQGVMSHPGNARYLRLIESYAEQYDLSDRNGKTNISREVVQTILDEQGRFLKRQQQQQCKNNDNDDGIWWEVVSAKDARKKVSHAFRSRRAILIARENRNLQEHLQLQYQQQQQQNQKSCKKLMQRR